MPLSQGVARFNRRVLNRLTRLFAGWAPGFAIVVHSGRRSGRVYRTPVNVFRDGDDYLIALTYGAETDWVRNVLAGGSCELLTRGRSISLARPRLITDADRRWAPQPVRLVLGLIGATQYLRMTQARAAEAPA
ncbi:MAG TPA: nitroreductase family deazaflavin-dependent oxidoreductase [Ktedonobacterales bacterium]|nr:nitroreductase family deazaflavin-dependent oxidoreductase [Ktedonobacterales bacterium]